MAQDKAVSMLAGIIKNAPSNYGMEDADAVKRAKQLISVFKKGGSESAEFFKAMKFMNVPDDTSNEIVDLIVGGSASDTPLDAAVARETGDTGKKSGVIIAKGQDMTPKLMDVMKRELPELSDKVDLKMMERVNDELAKIQDQIMVAKNGQTPLDQKVEKETEGPNPIVSFFEDLVGNVKKSITTKTSPDEVLSTVIEGIQKKQKQADKSLF